MKSLQNEIIKSEDRNYDILRKNGIINMMKKKITSYIKIIIIPFIFTLVGLGVVLFGLYGDSIGLVKEQFNEQQGLVARQTALAIEGSINLLVSELERLVVDDAVLTMDLVKLRRSMENTFEYIDQTYVNGVGYLDVDGVARITLGATNLEGVDFSYRSYYKDAKQLNDYLPTYEFIVFQGADLGDKGIVIAMPVFTLDKKFNGVMLFTIRVDDLLVKFKPEENKKSRYWVSDSSGNILYHPDYSINVAFEDTLLNTPSFVSFFNKIKTNEPYSSEYINKDNIRIISAAFPLKIANQHWAVIIESPESFIRQILILFSLKHTLITIVIILVILITSFVLVYLVNRWNFQLELQVAEQKYKENLLTKIKKDLEKKVNNRTKELNLTNANLRKEIAKQKKTEGKLLQSNISIRSEQEKLKTTIQSIADGVFVLDKSKKIVLANRVTELLSGYTEKEMVGKKYNKFLKFINEADSLPNEKFVDSIYLDGLPTKTDTTVLIAKNGKNISVSNSAAALKDVNNTIVGCVVIVRDVTKEREIGRLRTEFVSIASHQLRTPLTGISWFSELLMDKKSGKLTKKQKNYVEQLQFSNRKMINLVNDLLNVSRIESGKKFSIIKRDVNIIRVIDRVIEDSNTLSEGKKVKIIKYNKIPKKLLLECDEDKIYQVFNNLINNAIKYSVVGGKIKIGCDYVHEKEVVFSVQDEGVGIPKDEHKKVFQKFFRGSNIIKKETEGTGLGLYVAKAIVEGHGGKVWFESEENKGSTFYFSIPK